MKEGQSLLIVASDVIVYHYSGLENEAKYNPIDYELTTHAVGGLAGSGQTWNDVIATIFNISKIRRRQSMRIYMRNNPATFHFDPIWNDRALDLSGERRPNRPKNNKKNKMSSDMGSVSDQKNSLGVTTREFDGVARQRRQRRRLSSTAAAADEDEKEWWGCEELQMKTLLAGRDAVAGRRMSHDDYLSSLKRTVKFTTSGRSAFSVSSR